MCPARSAPNMHLLWLYAAVSVLAVLAAVLMRGFAPWVARLLGGLRGLTLRALSRDLDLNLDHPTALAHAVMRGQVQGRALRLQLGAGRLHLQLHAAVDLSRAPTEVAEYQTRVCAQRRLPGLELEFGASSLMLQMPLHHFHRRGALPALIQGVLAVLIDLERELESPESLAHTVRRRSLSGRLRARFLEYRVFRFGGASDTRELLIEARADQSPEVRITAARLLGPAGEDRLREMSLSPEALGGRTQRRLIDALLETRPEPLEPLLVALATKARSKTVLYLLARVADTNESLPVARAVLESTNADHENGLVACKAALHLLVAEHPVERWEQDVLRVLTDDHAPAALRQACFEALTRAGTPRSARAELQRLAARNVPLRSWAIAALARLEGPNTSEWLFELARRDPSARLPVLFAYPDLAVDGEPWLISCLDSESPLVLEQTLLNLEAAGSMRAWAPLRELRARLVREPDARMIIAHIDHCLERIRAHHEGSRGPTGGLSLSAPDVERGRLMLSPPGGSLSDPERTT